MKEKSSLFQRALQRLSFRSRKNRYDLVIEKKEVVNDTNKKLMKESATTPSSCPPSPYCSWRKTPSPPNHLKEKKESPGDNINISNSSLNLGRERRGGKETEVVRAQSLTVLDMAPTVETVTVPSNQLMHMNHYQKRVQVSMEKLNIPSWYKSPSNTPARSTPQTPRWKQSGREPSTSSSLGWRRHLAHSPSPSQTSSLERSATPLSSQRYRSRVRTMQSSSRSPSISSMNSSISSSTLPSPSKQVYLGWRSQERLNMDQDYLTSPASRLAKSVLHPLKKQNKINDEAIVDGTKDNTENVKNDIMDITEAILSYCSTSSHDKAPVAKDAWQGDDESDGDKDDKDDDSGIDRSDDYIQEIVN